MVEGGPVELAIDEGFFSGVGGGLHQFTLICPLSGCRLSIDRKKKLIYMAVKLKQQPFSNADHNLT